MQTLRSAATREGSWLSLVFALLLDYILCLTLVDVAECGLEVCDAAVHVSVPCSKSTGDGPISSTVVTSFFNDGEAVIPAHMVHIRVMCTRSLPMAKTEPAAIQVLTRRQPHQPPCWCKML